MAIIVKCYGFYRLENGHGEQQAVIKRWHNQVKSDYHCNEKSGSIFKKEKKKAEMKEKIDHQQNGVFQKHSERRLIREGINLVIAIRLWESR